MFTWNMAAVLNPSKLPWHSLNTINHFFFIGQMIVAALTPEMFNVSENGNRNGILLVESLGR